MATTLKEKTEAPKSRRKESVSSETMTVLRQVADEAAEPTAELKELVRKHRASRAQNPG
jgi:hypothetical protein